MISIIVFILHFKFSIAFFERPSVINFAFMYLSPRISVKTPAKVIRLIECPRVLNFGIATMKRGRCTDKVKESWEEFEKRVRMKRTGSANAKRVKVPEDLLVQRISSLPIGRGKKFEPMDTKDFVPFKEYDELSIENIKEACEVFYNAPSGSCEFSCQIKAPLATKWNRLKVKRLII